MYIIVQFISTGYLAFWSVVLLICNTCVWVFKKDNSADVIEKNEELSGILNSYRLIWRILKLKAVLQLSVVVLLSKVSKFRAKFFREIANIYSFDSDFCYSGGNRAIYWPVQVKTDAKWIKIRHAGVVGDASHSAAVRFTICLEKVL